MFFEVPAVQQQKGGTDCGVFAIAFAYHAGKYHSYVHIYSMTIIFILNAANADDLRIMKFDQAKIRQHLEKCFQNKQFTPFPHTVLPAPYPQTLPAHSIEVFCDCELPETFDNMVQCDKCEMWFHLTCVGLNTSTPISQTEWFCKTCRQITTG